MPDLKSSFYIILTYSVPMYETSPFTKSEEQALIELLIIIWPSLASDCFFSYLRWFGYTSYSSYLYYCYPRAAFVNFSCKKGKVSNESAKV